MQVAVEIIYVQFCVDIMRQAELAQLAERTTLNRVVEGSIPSFGVLFAQIPPYFGNTFLSPSK